VGVADRDDGVASVEVEILRAVGRIDTIAYAAHGLQRIERIDIEKFHVRKPML
jgi:hypothetical protein